MSSHNTSINTLLAAPVQTETAIDSVTLVIHECMVLSAAMRKSSRWASSGVAAILGAGDLFDDEEDRVPFPVRSERNVSSDSPLLSSFFQLRAMLVDLEDLSSVDALTLLQPFLLAIKSSSTSGHITSLALVAISKFLQYNVIGASSKNIQGAVSQIMASLTHCRFEAGDQATDDAVLLHVLRLVESVMNSPLSELLSDETISEVTQTFLRLACNKKRSEVLRRSAEMSMDGISRRIFRKLETIEVEGESDLRMSFSGKLEGGEDIGARAGTPQEDFGESTTSLVDPNTTADTNLTQEDTKNLNDTFGIVCINEFLGILVSMISPVNQYQHTESTRVFALSLINSAVESTGKHIAKHPSLMRLIADAGFKNILHIITSSDSSALLTEALQLFTTVVVVLGEHLKAQIELSISMIFNAVVSDSRTAQSKETIIESISLLWTRKPSFFTTLFVNYDCDFDRSDLAVKVLKELCRLSLPEAAKETTDSVPPVCLEALLQFISGVSDRSTKKIYKPKALLNKDKKTSFIEAAESFDKKPSEGLKKLEEGGFISDAKNPEEVALFLFNKGGRLNKKVVGEFLCKPSNKEILRIYMKQFEFGGLGVDDGLRVLLRSFRLPGESQMIERIVENFAQCWFDSQKNAKKDSKDKKQNLDKAEGNKKMDNNRSSSDEEAKKEKEGKEGKEGKEEEEEEEEEEVIPPPDDVFLLSYSIIMLNTDLHNPQVKKQMDFASYQRQLRGQYAGKDYPEWYLAKIYQSIKDREIIMPEEHHGTETWFDDTWMNTIAIDAGPTVTPDFESLPSFDKALFSLLADEIISTLIKVFRSATDDHIITRLMSSVDKCASICMDFGLYDSVDILLSSLAEQTALLSKEDRIGPDESSREDIPVTQIQIDGREEITVSEAAVWFGRDFKAQISTVVLFRLTKKTGYKVSPAWKKLVKIILVLVENCLIDPNTFVPSAKLQSKFGLGNLYKVKPRYAISRTKPLRDAGLLSTFSSFLKGYADIAPEPTDQEVESTLSTMDCVKSLQIKAIFDNVDGKDRDTLCSYFLDAIPEYSEDIKRYYENELLFIAELVASWPDDITKTERNEEESILNRILALPVDNLTKRGTIRLLTIKLNVLKHGGSPDILKSIINSLESQDIKRSNVLKPLIELGHDEKWSDILIASEEYWKLFRQLAVQPAKAYEIIDFVENLLKNKSKFITPTNYMTFLGLLDELSSLAAMTIQPECEESDKIITMSKRSISLTLDLASLTKENVITDEEMKFSLYQAIAHQCFNPCTAIRTFALSKLQISLLNSGLSAQGMFELVLFPLLSELDREEVSTTDPPGFIRTQVETLILTCKIFLHFLGDLGENVEAVWLGILDHSVSYQKQGGEQFDNSFKETGSEVFKNVVLVLQSSQILHEDKKESWNQTWRRVNALDSRIKKEVVIPQIKKEEGPNDKIKEEKVGEDIEKTDN